VFERAGARLPASAGGAPGTGRLDAAGAEIVAELLERWASLSADARVRLARQVLERYGGGEPGEPRGEADATWRARLERLAERR
jgi:hypothetical protein